MSKILIQRPSNTTGGVTSIDVPFEPCVKIGRDDGKCVFERNQNIVCMKEYLNVSPEELRSQFYAKIASEPFKFSASIESGKTHGYKKTVTRGSQTCKDVTHKKFDTTRIWKALECPVCLDVVLPPVYQCEQGHHLCSACWSKVHTCPLCKRSKSRTRNFIAENLVEQIPLPCKYRIMGCKIVVQHERKVRHEEMCVFRAYPCPVPLCNQALWYQSMCEHFKKVHGTLLQDEGRSFAEGEIYSDVLYKENLPVSLVHAFDIRKWGLFFLREVTLQQSRALFVQVIPANNDHYTYLYYLEVSDHQDRRKECYRGCAFPLGKLTQEIVDQEEYLFVTKLISKTMQKDAPLKIIVKIWKEQSAITPHQDIQKKST